MSRILTSQEVSSFYDKRTKQLPGQSYKLAGGQFGLDVAIATELQIDASKMMAVINFADGSRRDGVGDLLEVGGINTERHRNNPVILWDHGKEIALPIALAEEPETSQYTVELDPVLKVGTVPSYFYQGRNKEANDLADAQGVTSLGISSKALKDHALFCEQLYDLWCKKFIRGGSLGYQVVKAMPLQPDYDRGIPQGLHLLSTLMLEASAVVMPANMDTVRKSFPDYGQLVRQVLAMPAICGKPLNPYLIKSLAPYADAAPVQVVGGFAKHNAQCAFSGELNKQPSDPNADPMGMNSKSQIPGDLNWLKEEQTEAKHKCMCGGKCAECQKQAKAMEAGKPCTPGHTAERDDCIPQQKPTAPKIDQSSTGSEDGKRISEQAYKATTAIVSKYRIKTRRTSPHGLDNASYQAYSYAQQGKLSKVADSHIRAANFHEVMADNTSNSQERTDNLEAARLHRNAAAYYEQYKSLDTNGKSTPVPFTQNLSKTNVPPSRWKPGVGAIKRIRAKYKSQSPQWRVTKDRTRPGKWVVVSRMTNNPIEYYGNDFWNTEDEAKTVVWELEHGNPRDEVRIKELTGKWKLRATGEPVHVEKDNGDGTYTITVLHHTKKPGKTILSRETITVRPEELERPTFGKETKGIEGDRFLIVWTSPKWGDVVAGSVHDWESNENAKGVMEFPTEESARRFIREYLGETPIRVVKRSGRKALPNQVTKAQHRGRGGGMVPNRYDSLTDQMQPGDTVIARQTLWQGAPAGVDAQGNVTSPGKEEMFASSGDKLTVSRVENGQVFVRNAAGKESRQLIAHMRKKTPSRGTPEFLKREAEATVGKGGTCKQGQTQANTGCSPASKSMDTPQSGQTLNQPKEKKPETRHASRQCGPGETHKATGCSPKGKGLKSKYRTSAKGLRRRLRRSQPGKSLVHIHSKHMGQAELFATQRGLKWERLGPHGPYEKVRLTGDDNAIDAVAVKFAVRVKSMGTKAFSSELKPGEAGYDVELSRQQQSISKMQDTRLFELESYLNQNENTAYANAVRNEAKKKGKNKKSPPNARSWENGSKANNLVLVVVLVNKDKPTRILVVLQKENPCQKNYSAK